MNNKKDISDEDKLRELLSTSKLSAGENLKYRIMQQIETEKVFAPQKTIKSTKPVLRSVLSIAVVLYVLVLGFGVWAYAGGGFSALVSAHFLLPVVTISSICAIYGLIIVIDEKRYL